MNIGRNEPCPCGSGKKYKNCCRDKNTLIQKRIIQIAEENKLSKQIQEVISNLFTYMINKPLYGGCISLSLLLYIALCELGENPDLYIGVCKFEDKPQSFDHSWVVLNNKIIDIAIYMPMTQSFDGSGVVIMSTDTLTNTPTNIIYGCKGISFDDSTKSAIQMSFCEYMDSYTLEPNGLWDVLQKVLPDEVPLDIDNIKTKYADVQRIIVS